MLPVILLFPFRSSRKDSNSLPNLGETSCPKRAASQARIGPVVFCRYTLLKLPVNINLI